jgi:hypothetical protein
MVRHEMLPLVAWAAESNVASMVSQWGDEGVVQAVVPIVS